MVKDIVVIADLGAASNLVRNILLTSNQCHWPLSTNKLNLILSQYDSIALNQWLAVEYRLRFWKQYYNVDISDNIDMMQFEQRFRTDQPVVYINHSAFYQPNEYQKLKNIVDILYVAPTTKFGLDWQIRSYCEKKTVEKLHNFTFVDNVQEQIQDYCNKYGVNAYQKLNIQNFKHIVDARQKQFGPVDIPLEILLWGDAEKLINLFNDKINVFVDVETADKILTAWRKLHWPLDQTNCWEYHSD